MTTEAKLRPGERAFTRTDALVTVGSVAILLVVAFSSVVGCRAAKALAQDFKCRNNLRAKALAFRVFANDNLLSTNSTETFPQHVPLAQLTLTQGTNASLLVTYFRAASNELAAPSMLLCPADSERVLATDWTNLTSSNISFFLSLDARPDAPETILMGDRNLESVTPRAGSRLELTASTPVSWGRSLHDGCGQFALSDGSVHHSCGTKMPPVFLRSLAKVATNRLEFP